MLFFLEDGSCGDSSALFAYIILYSAASHTNSSIYNDSNTLRARRGDLTNAAEQQMNEFKCGLTLYFFIWKSHFSSAA